VILKSALVTLISMAFASGAQAADSRASTNKEIAIQSMTDVFVNRDLTGIERYFAEPYIQHRTDVGDGLVELRGFLANILKERPTFSTHIYRAISDGDMVMLHSVYVGSPRAEGELLAAFDLFRFKHGRIVEHWDALTLQGAPNLSGHSTVDGPAAIADLQKTEANRGMVTRFVDTVFVRRQVDRAGEFIDDKRYFEHALLGKDGMEAFKAKTRSNPKVGYKVHRILAEGNFVVVEAEAGGGTQVHYDLYRLQAGKVVEHWDVQSAVPPRSTWKNNHGPF